MTDDTGTSRHTGNCHSTTQQNVTARVCIISSIHGHIHKASCPHQRGTTTTLSSVAIDSRNRIPPLKIKVQYLHWPSRNTETYGLGSNITCRTPWRRSARSDSSTLTLSLMSPDSSAEMVAPAFCTVNGMAAAALRVRCASTCSVSMNSPRCASALWTPQR